MLNELLSNFDFSHFGWTALTKPLSLDFYREWLEDGNHAGMEYLKDHFDVKAEPRKLAPKARSAIVFAKPYLPHPYPASASTKLRTALYSQGTDYHIGFRDEIRLVARRLREEFPGEEFLCFTDSSPILERDLAYRAGLGWVGKNACLISPQEGSLFFIGEIFTSMDLTSDNAPVADMCGTCDRCLRACPTGALEAPKTLNAGKCISYWTIEAKEAAPVELREKFGDWFFGCDICQTVCPWNEKVFGRESMRALSADQLGDDLEEDLRWILTQSHRSTLRRFGDLPFDRARPIGLKRNALYVIGNRRLNALKPEVERLAADEKMANSHAGRFRS